MVANVLDYGAVGDGIANDTAAFTSALAAVDCVELTKTHLVTPGSFPNGSGKTLLFNGGVLKTAFSALSGIRIRSGGSFSTTPTLTITGDGTGAAATAIMGAFRPYVAAGGSGYSFRTIVEVQGGTSTQKARITITGQSGGIVTSAFVSQPGSYTVLPSNPVSVTVVPGTGTGTGATFTLEWQIVGATVTAAGTGYVAKPTVAASGGVLLTPVLDTVGAELDFYGQFNAVPARIFVDYGGLTSNHTNKIVHPEWWGAANNTESGEALQTALDASFGKTLLLGSATYRTSRALTPPASITVKGVNRVKSVIQPMTNTHVFLLEQGFDAYFEDFAVMDSSNVMGLTAAAFYFDATRNLIQRTYFKDMLLDIAGRGFATPSFERVEVFGCEFDNVNIYSKGASLEFFYTTGCKLRHVLGEHVGRAQDSTILRDFWFYSSTAMLGGGLILQDVTSRSPYKSGIVLEGPGGSYAYPRFLQAWLYDCSVDAAGGHGVHILNGEQIHVHRGYFALCGARISGNCLRAQGGFSLTIQDAQFHDGYAANVYVFSMSGVIVEGNLLRRTGVYPSNVGIQFDNNAGAVYEFQANGNSVRNCSKGIQVLGSANLFQIIGNNCTYNGSGSADGVSISGTATNYQNAYNLT